MSSAEKKKGASQATNQARASPLDILSEQGCKVQSLTVSDQHATLLLSHTVQIEKDIETPDAEGSEEPSQTTKTVSSLLKLTLVPFHKALLGSNPVVSAEDIERGQFPERNLLQHNPKTSEEIVSFLRKYNFRLKSDSGAEYSYYAASPSSELGGSSVGHVEPAATGKEGDGNKDSNTAKESETSLIGTAASSFGAFDIELISPASSYQISRSMPSLGHVLVRETTEMYNAVAKPYIKSIVDGGSLSWIRTMTDSKDKKKEDSPPTTVTVKKTETVAPKYPPVEAAARRLERLFGGSRTNAAASASAPLINQSKILKKWLGSSSGTAGKATLAQIASCAERTLDPAGSCATGRELLMGLATEEERAAVLKELNEKKDDEKKKDGDKKKEADAMEEDADEEDVVPAAVYLVKSAREVESWLVSLAVRIQWRAKDGHAAYDWTEKGLKILDAHLADCPSDSAGVGGLYPLLARMLRYRSLTLESLPPSTKSALIANQRPELAGRHTMAVLRRDADVSATVLNIMLHDLLEGDQVEQAQKLLSNATFPTENASNNQLLRYLYSSGRIQALRLEYTQAHSNLSQALRKSPTNTGLGFRIAVQRLLVVVQLLMGEIPDRGVFFGEGMRAELRPYLEIAQAVRRGDLAVFHATVNTHAERLRADGTYTLISRLAHSVVKAGLRRLKTSYSRISLEDVAHRLGLPSATSAEFVVAKAVRDGVIDATIDHEKKYVQSHDLVDVYATVEPSEAFHRRIAYCLTTHNDAVRSMRYTPDAYKKQLEASRGLSRRGRGGDDDKTDEEKAKEIEDELDEDY